METTIHIDDKKVLKKSYKLRSSGRNGSTIETSIPQEVFDREARRLGLTREEALEKLVAVWRFNSFRGLHLSFEANDEEKHCGQCGHWQDRCLKGYVTKENEKTIACRESIPRSVLNE